MLILRYDESHYVTFCYSSVNIFQAHAMNPSGLHNLLRIPTTCAILLLYVET